MKVVERDLEIKLKKLKELTEVCEKVKLQSSKLSNEIRELDGRKLMLQEVIIQKVYSQSQRKKTNSVVAVPDVHSNVEPSSNTNHSHSPSSNQAESCTIVSSDSIRTELEKDDKVSTESFLEYSKIKKEKLERMRDLKNRITSIKNELENSNCEGSVLASLNSEYRFLKSQLQEMASEYIHFKSIKDEFEASSISDASSDIVIITINDTTAQENEKMSEENVNKINWKDNYVNVKLGITAAPSRPVSSTFSDLKENLKVTDKESSSENIECTLQQNSNAKSKPSFSLSSKESPKKVIGNNNKEPSPSNSSGSNCKKVKSQQKPDKSSNDKNRNGCKRERQGIALKAKRQETEAKHIGKEKPSKSKLIISQEIKRRRELEKLLRGNGNRNENIRAHSRGAFPRKPLFNLEHFDVFSHSKDTVKCRLVRMIKVHKNYIFVAMAMGSMQKFNVENPKENLTFEGHKSNIRTFCVYEITDHLYTGCDDGILRQFNSNTGELKNSFHLSSPILCMEPGKTVLFIGLSNGLIYRLGLMSEKLINSFPISKNRIYGIKLASKDSEERRILVCCESEISIQSVSNEFQLGRFSVTAFEVDDEFFYVGLENGEILCFSYKSNDFKPFWIYLLRSPKVYITSLCFFEKQLIATNSEGLIEKVSMDDHFPHICEYFSCGKPLARKLDLKKHFTLAHSVDPSKESVVNCGWKNCGILMSSSESCSISNSVPQTLIRLKFYA
ncbi:zinc finger protein 106-like protein [Dinothrombium tinctorium]|uniref:Zinc finger protein 106-like protein n=1 Tax=Dinothrombium tinctorium TaxID=1965070 RepID=A0A443QRB4_9ACAR|nr:zinc finger protein 106-like protein [Dinothrombium tinctorium]